MAEHLKSECLGGGRVRSFHREDDKVVVSTSTDVESLVEANKRQYNDAPERFGDGTFHRVADIPHDEIENLWRRSGLSFQEFMNPSTSPEAAGVWSRFLNDRDKRAFRTRPGNVVVKAR
jgi:hypothetical protein